jgi:hypothetical protein
MGSFLVVAGSPYRRKGCQGLLKVMLDEVCKMIDAGER